MTENSGELIKRTLREVFGLVLKRTSLRQSFSVASAALSEIRDAGRRLGALGRTVRIVAIGKAGSLMADELIARTELSNYSGVVSSPYDHKECPARLEGFCGGHPQPNNDSLRAGIQIVDMLSGLAEDDMVVFLLSGGGSAAVEFPIDPNIAIDELISANQSLVTCGANIVEINTIRKHLSALKGGRMALRAFPSRQITLYASDVPNDLDSFVASGPTMPDESTVEEATGVMRKYSLHLSLPSSVRRVLEDQDLEETPKPGHPAFGASSWFRLADNSLALKAAMRICTEAGWRCIIDTSSDEDSAADSAAYLLRRLAVERKQGSLPVCIIAGGEVRVKVTGSGLGGRNQAFVLECIPSISGERIAILSGGTDGIDGNSDAAGAVADGRSAERIVEAKIDLERITKNSDSNRLFRILRDDVVTGPTGNNIRDLRLLLAY